MVSVIHQAWEERQNVPFEILFATLVAPIWTLHARWRKIKESTPRKGTSKQGGFGDYSLRVCVFMLWRNAHPPVTVAFHSDARYATLSQESQTFTWCTACALKKRTEWRRVMTLSPRNVRYEALRETADRGQGGNEGLECWQWAKQPLTHRAWLSAACQPLQKYT